MATKARVASIEAMEEFRGAFCQFEEDSKAALNSVDMEVRRSLSWLKQDRLPYWQSEERRWRQKLAEARTQLSRKRISTPHGPPKDSFEKELVREAEARLKEAEEKLFKIKKWIPVLERGVEEYHGHSRPLGDFFAHSVPLGIAKLQSMLKSLGEYIAVAAPRLPGDLRTPRDSAGSAAVSASSSSSIENDGAAVQSQDHEQEQEQVQGSMTERASADDDSGKIAERPISGSEPSHTRSGDDSDAGGEPERGRESP